jgi:acyl-CoA synthetase (AMP-forming)/AMP-acid ligase II
MIEFYEAAVAQSIEFGTVRDLIDRRAEAQPADVFLISPETGRELTFEELRQQCHHLYRRFRRLGLEHGDKIAFLMDNGLFAANLFLGAMYGGFVIVPLNLRAGTSQLSYTLNHCDAKFVFVGNEYRPLIQEVIKNVSRSVEVIPADHDLDEAEMPIDPGTLPPVIPEDAALIMYSSGTVGQPNGAVHSHRSILAHGRNTISSYRLTPEDRSLLVLPLYHINAECVTLIPTLMSGGSVVVPHGFVVSEFWNWLNDQRCTWSALVPTIIAQLLDWKDPKAESREAALRRLRFLRSSSAPLSPSMHREFLDKFKVLLVQAMGSSEAGNVFSNPLPPGANKIGSAGLPWGFETKVVGSEGAELAAGEPGEVLVRGAGLMQGYYKDKAGTTAAVDADGWIHTGDLAYRDEDGYFFVVGRSKELIIKGGMNIAPKQIDEVLESHPAVLEAAAVGVPDRHVGEDVVAFAILRSGMRCDERELLRFCETRLGPFKTPTRIHFVPDLPKGPSGKIQRLRLVTEAQRLALVTPASETVPSAPTADAENNPLFANEGHIEQIIAGVWSDVLAQPRIDPQVDFFALGGQSLLAIQCLSRLREKLPVILSLADFFENATVGRQAALVRKRVLEAHAQAAALSAHSNDDKEPIPRRDRTLPCPLSPSQERLWFMEQLTPGEPVYNEAEAVRLRGKFDVAALERALNSVIARHEILRTTIEVVDERPIAVVHETWPTLLKRIDLRALSIDAREAELARLLVDEPRHIYRLESEPGVRFAVIQLSADEHVFILMMHHMICDRLSVGILWRELGALYESLLHGQRSSLPTMPIQYGDYATWLRQPIRQSQFEEDVAFWKENLRGAPTVIDLPADRPRPSTNSYRGDELHFHLDSALAKDVRRLCREERTSLFALFAAALNALLFRYTGQDDILIGIPIAERDRPELQSMIGFLVQTHALRTHLTGDVTFRELMASVQQGLMAVYAHRAVPFAEVVAALQPERSLSHAPLFQVMLNWRDRNAQLQFIGLPGLAVQPLQAQAKISKFDVTLFVTDTETSIELEFEYSTDLFDASRIERMFGHLRTLLEGVVTNPEQPLAQLPLLTRDERHQLLVEWNTVHADAGQN